MGGLKAGYLQSGFHYNIQLECVQVFNYTREENTTSTSIVINDLEENSIYTVTISAVNNQSNAINTTSGLTITTLAAGMFT